MTLIDVKYRAYCRDGSVECNNFDDVVKFELEPAGRTKIVLDLGDDEELVFYKRVFVHMDTGKTTNIIYFVGKTSSPNLVQFNSLTGETFEGKDKLRENYGDINT